MSHPLFIETALAEREAALRRRAAHPELQPGWAGRARPRRQWLATTTRAWLVWAESLRPRRAVGCEV
jgi:hypothetical protein